MGSIAEGRDLRGTDTRVLVFTRAPVPGATKRRLIPALGRAGAAALHRRMLIRAIETVAQAGVGQIELWCSPSHEHPFFRALAERFDLRLRDQQGRDLGERMCAALAEAVSASRSAILIGSDCPELQVSDLRQGADWLEEGGDAVIGPSHDGGYYLLGLRKVSTEIFEGIPWGTPAVLEETLRKLDRLGWRWRQLPVRRDVDTPADLSALEIDRLPPAELGPK